MAEHHKAEDTSNGANNDNSANIFKMECVVGKRHMQEIFRDLDSQRRAGAASLCDVVLKAEGRSFPAHKCVLVATSDYFRSMFHVDRFSESKSKEVELHLICADALTRILDMIYTGVLKLDIDSVYTTVAAADQLMLANVKTHCEQFLNQLICHWYPAVALGLNRSGDQLNSIRSPDPKAAREVLKIKRCAEMYNLTHLSQTTERIISANFELISQTSDFLALSIEEVSDLLSSDEMQVTSEEVLWQAAVRWLEEGDEFGSRSKHIDILMASIRFPLMDSKFLLSTVRNHPTMSSVKCQRFMQDAIAYQLLPEERSSKQTSQTKPRCTTQTTIIYCLAGTKQFMCFLPHKDEWFALPAPLQYPALPPPSAGGHDLLPSTSAKPEEKAEDAAEPRVGDGEEHFYRLLSVGGYVFVRVLSRSSEQVGNYVLRRLQMYSITSNTWTECRLPEVVQFAILIECNGTLYSCSRQGVEAYSPEFDRWSEKQRMTLPPCQFAVSDQKKIYLFNLEDGSIEIIHTDKQFQTTKSQMMWLSRFEVLSLAKLSNHEVFLSLRQSTGILRKVVNVRTNYWQDANKRMCHGPTPVTPKPGDNYPHCLSLHDPWEVVYDRNKNEMYILAKWSAISNCPGNQSGDGKKDAVLPFFKIDTTRTWRRQAALQEVLVTPPLGSSSSTRLNVHMCIADGQSSMATSLP